MQALWHSVSFLPWRFMLSSKPQSRNRLWSYKDWVRAKSGSTASGSSTLGDDAAWASPSFDDSAWEPIHSSSSWGSQDHPAYTGFAWYRRHLQIHTADGSNSHYVLLMPPVDDAYEVYWNGDLIGSYGKLPPHPHWYYTSFFPLVSDCRRWNRE